MRWWLSLLGIVLTALPCTAATATLAWDRPAQGTPTMYRVERAVTDGAWTIIVVVDAPETTYTDPAPVRGTQSYRVRAQNATGESPPSNVVTIQCTARRCRAR